MFRKVFSIFIGITFFFILPAQTLAIVDPLAAANNRFGIHILNEGDLDNAANLVNSSGGDWGYVTIVIPENERIVEKWQRIFDSMRSLHLIPLVRLATTLNGDYWNAPAVSDAVKWTEFLSQLKWVTRNRYVIIFNEPNHSKEWGMKLDPGSYAQILSTFSATLKKSSGDYFILPAGLDASAPNSWNTMDEEQFLKKMRQEDPDIFDKIDGWNSHSYPNPGFSGESKNLGRGSITTYRWELELIKNLGVVRKLPVFITETGWPHQDGSIFNRWFKKTDDIPLLLQNAVTNIWIDEYIVAITPFILNYQSYPFSNFSWQKLNSNEFYPQYGMYQNVSKIKGEPVLEEVLNEKVLAAQITPSIPKVKSQNSIYSIIQSVYFTLIQFISSLF